ncbi:hypothetical protein JCM5350_004865 [Sporobolomyces pararoseus]
MGIPGHGQAIDKQQEKNAKAREKVESRPPYLGTRIQTTKTDSGAITEQEKHFRKSLKGQKRTYEAVRAGDGGVEEVEWSYKGPDFQSGVDWMNLQLDGDFISRVIVDASNHLVPLYVMKDYHYRNKILHDPTQASVILQERRHDELRTIAILADKLREACPHAELIVVYDNSEYRPVEKDKTGALRLQRSALAKGSRLSKKAVNEFKENDVIEKGRKKNLKNNGPPQICMSDENAAKLPAFAPPTASEEGSSLDSTPLEQAIAAEATKLLDTVTFIVSTGEADPVCRDLGKADIDIMPRHRIEFYSRARKPVPTPVARAEFSEEWVEKVTAVGESSQGRSIIYANDTDYSVINSSTTVDFWISESRFGCRVVDFAKRSQHPLNWRYSSETSSTMAAVLTGCDFTDGLSGFTVVGVGTRRPADKPRTKHQAEEDVIFEICEKALEWRKAYYELYESRASLSTVTIGGQRRAFTHICDLRKAFHERISPLFSPTKTIPKLKESLDTAMKAFDTLLDGRYEELRSKEELLGPIEKEVEKRTNNELRARFVGPGARNHLFPTPAQSRSSPRGASSTSLSLPGRQRRNSLPESPLESQPSPAVATLPRPRSQSVNRVQPEEAVVDRPKPAPRSPPIARRSRRHSLPPNWRRHVPGTPFPPSPPAPSTPIKRRNSFVDKHFTWPDHHSHTPYQSRGGPDAMKFLGSLFSTCDKWQGALSKQLAEEEKSQRPLKKAKLQVKVDTKGKGKAKEAEKDDGGDERDAENGEGEEGEKEKVKREKAVGTGAKEFGLATSTINIPLRPSSINNLLFSGLPAGQQFNHAILSQWIDLLNLWLSEAPAILDLVNLLIQLYSEYAPQLLTNLINRGGQKFGDVIATLVQRTAKYYQAHPLGNDLPKGDSSTLEQAPQWLKKRVDAVLKAVPRERRTRFWELVDSMGFTEDDFKIFGSNEEFNIFGMIVVKLRRMKEFPPPLLQHVTFITRNMATCGTGLSNALISRGQKLHRTAASVLLSYPLDFLTKVHLNPYGVDTSKIQQLSASFSTYSVRKGFSSTPAAELLQSLPRKKLLRLISLEIYNSPLPDASTITNSPVRPPESDPSDETAEEEEEDSEDLMFRLFEFGGYGPERSPSMWDQMELEDEEYQDPGGDDDDPMELEPGEEEGYNGFRARVSQLVKNAALRRASTLLSSEDLLAAATPVTEFLVLGAAVMAQLIGASYIEAIRSSPKGNSLRKYRTIGQLVVAGGGKEEKLKKNESFYLRENDGEKEEGEEETEDSTRFLKNVELSTLMTATLELRCLVALLPVNFEPDGYHVDLTELYFFSTPSNSDYLPKRIEELWHRQEAESRAFNKLCQESSSSTVPPFKAPPIDSAPGPRLEAAQMINSMIGDKEKKFMKDQVNNSDKILFPVLQDYRSMEYIQEPGDGPLPVRRFTVGARLQREEQAATVRAFIDTFKLNGGDLKEFGHELWRYIIKPDIGTKKFFHGTIYVNRNKISALCLDSEKFTRKGLKDLQKHNARPQGSRETIETLFSKHPRVPEVYLKVEAARAAHARATGEEELVSVKRHSEVEGSSWSPTRIVNGQITRTRTRIQQLKIIPFTPLLRPRQDRTDPVDPMKPRYLLQFARPLSSAASNPPPRLDDRKPIRLYTNPTKPEGRWTEWCQKNVREPFEGLRPQRNSPSSIQGHSPSTLLSPGQASSSSSTRSPPELPPTLSNQQPLASTPEIADSAPSTIPQPLPDLGVGTSRNPPPRIEVEQDYEMADERSGQDWRAEIIDWLDRTRGALSPAVIIGSDPGRAYSLVTSALRVAVGQVEFYRTRSSAALVQERAWNERIQEIKPLEARYRLAQTLQDSSSPSFTTDLSKLFLRSSPPTPSTKTTITRRNIADEHRFPSESSEIPSSLQGALLHSPDYISSTQSFLERQRRQSQIESDAARLCADILPRPQDGSKIPVAIVRSTAQIGGISKVKGKGRNDSGVREDALVHAVRALEYTEDIEVECTEANSSQVCACCGSTLIHPCRIGDPLLAKILRLYYCIVCQKMIHRDDNGALNIIAIALGIAFVGMGNILSRETAQLLGNSNRFSKHQQIILENQFHHTLLLMDEAKRIEFLEDMEGEELLKVLRITRSRLAAMEADEEMEEAGDEE